jgi:cell division protein FtsL
MRDDGVVLLGKPIDNSRVVRQVDPRSRGEIWLLIVLVTLLAAGLGLYAWPALEIGRSRQESVQLYRQKEKLLEQKRKLQLERAALENLNRIETIASRDLGLAPPRAEQSVVVEVPRQTPKGTTVARENVPAREARATDTPEARP